MQRTRCAGKLNVRSEHGRTGARGNREVQCIEGAQRRAERLYPAPRVMVVGGTDFQPAVQTFLLMRVKLFESRARRGRSKFPRAYFACEHRGKFEFDQRRYGGCVAAPQAALGTLAQRLGQVVGDEYRRVDIADQARSCPRAATTSALSGRPRTRRPARNAARLGSREAGGTRGTRGASVTARRPRRRTITRSPRATRSRISLRRRRRSFVPMSIGGAPEGNIPSVHQNAR